MLLPAAAAAAAAAATRVVNHLTGTLKLHSNGPFHSNTVIGTPYTVR